MAYNVDSLRACYVKQVFNLEIDTDLEFEYDKYVQHNLDMDYVFGPVMISLCIISAAVSLVNTVILTRKTMISYSLNVLLVVLEISNIVLAVILCIQVIIQIMFGQFVSNEGVLVLKILIQECGFVAVIFINWFTVLIGSWRFIAVNWPLKSASMLTRKRATTFSIIIFLFSTFPEGFSGLLFKIENDNINICSDMNGLNFTSYNYYFYIHPPWVLAYKRTIANLFILVYVVYYLLPCVCFLAITGGLLWSLYQNTVRKRTLREGQSGAHTEEGQTRTTLILILMLSLFLVSNTVLLIISLSFNSLNHKELYYKLMRIFIHFPLSLLTNTMSLVFYNFMGTNFRNNFLVLFGISSKAKRAISTSVQTIESDVV